MGGKRAERTTAWGLVTLGMVAAVTGGLFSRYSRFHWYDEVIHTQLLRPRAARGRLCLRGGAYGRVRARLRPNPLGDRLRAGDRRAVGDRRVPYDHFIVKSNVILPKRDTTMDMVLDTAGALMAGLVPMWTLRK